MFVHSMRMSTKAAESQQYSGAIRISCYTSHTYIRQPFCHGRDVSVDLPQVSPDLRSADPKTISRGITVLSNSQSYVKSFDGMAYELKGKLKEGTSTDDIQTVRGV